MSFLNTYARYPLELVRGEGVRLQGADGRWYLDGLCGIAVMSLGHGHPAVLKAVHAQVDRLLHVSNLFHVDVQRSFAELLASTYRDEDGPAAVFLGNSGVEANEGAVKLARKWHWRRGDPRVEILTAHGAFHGRTLLGLAMTPKAKYREGFGPLPDEVRSVPVEELPAAVSHRTAAVVVEPVQGEGGCVPVENLAQVRAACDAAGALLIYDEIQCGLGRTGTLHERPAPDVRTLAKALGGGLPLSAVVARSGVMSGFQPGDHGSTFGGNPVACAAAKATLEVILGEDLPARCAALGARLAAGLRAAGAKVTGRGLMAAAWIDQPAGPVIDRMREQGGVLVCSAGDSAVRFLPPFVMDEGEIDTLVEAFRAAL